MNEVLSVIGGCVVTTLGLVLLMGSIGGLHYLFTKEK